MQSRGTAPRVGISSHDLPEWDGIAAAAGPVASVYFDTVVHDVTTPKELDLLWRDVRDDLEQLGAPATALDAIAGQLAFAHTRAGMLAAIADKSGLLLARDLEAPVPRQRFELAALPVLGPLIEWLQTRETHIVAVADHLGADITVVGREIGSWEEQVGEEDPHDPELHNTKPGGWSQRRYQARTKRRWRMNAGDAAQRVNELVESLHPRFVAVAGDVRAVSLLLDQLSSTARVLAREIPGTRARDGSDDEHDAALRHLLRSVIDEDDTALREKFLEELGQRDRGATGVRATLDALNAARVDTLLVHDDPADVRNVWFSYNTPMLSITRDELEAVGADRVAEGRLVDAAIRTALLTGASVRMVDDMPELQGGIGAILRH